MVVIGECMLELTHDADRWQLSCAGDTFRTAVYLSRLGVPTTFITALGTDPFSVQMREDWQAEGLDTSLVLTDGARLPGLYAVRNDGNGERQSDWWRDRAAARQLFTLAGIEAAIARARSAKQLYLTGNTLSLFSPAEREQLRDIAAAVRAAQGEVIFDPNYRAAVWASADEARAAVRALSAYVSTVMPAYADEAELFGDPSPGHTLVRWRDWGAQQIVMKMGVGGCLVASASSTEWAQPVKVENVMDARGAGDAFNAGYLAARAMGQAPVVAGVAGNRLAALVLRHRRAILPRAQNEEIRSVLQVAC